LQKKLKFPTGLAHFSSAVLFSLASQIP